MDVTIKPVKVSNIRCASLVIVIILLALYTYFGSSSIIDNSLFIYIVKPIVWIVIIISIAMFPAIRTYGKLRGRTILIWVAAMFGVIYIITMLVTGFFVGLGKSPFNHSLKGILMNITTIFIPLLGRELLRSYLVNSYAKRKAFFAMGAIVLLMTFTNISMDILESNSNSKIVEIVCGNYIPELCNNVLACYLVFLGGAIPSILFMGVIQGFYWFSPILPNLTWIMKSLIGVLCPVFSLTLLQYIYDTYIIKDRKSIEKSEKPFGWIVATLFSIAIIWLASGVFVVQPYVIATGSMRPLIKPGDVVIVEKVQAKKIKVGDIVQYQDDDIFIFHRVINIYENKSQKKYITKGDNNSVSDFKPVNEKQIKGKVVYIVPKIGWPTLLLKKGNKANNVKVEF